MKDARAILAHGVVGFSDSPPKHADFQIAGMALLDWVSTYCFAMSNEVLRLLGDELFKTGEIDACVRGGLDP